MADSQPRPPGQASRPVSVLALADGSLHPGTREVIEEEPLRLVVNGEAATTLMRTPGHEVELALGYALTEGLARGLNDIAAVTFCREGELGPAGEVRIRLAGETAPSLLRRHREVFSSCGLCGLALIEAYADDLVPFARPVGRLVIGDVLGLRDATHAAQETFRRTGGCHAAAVGELPLDASRVVVREDVGRHNALDKAVGAAAGQHLRPERSLLVLSGRLSFEMVAKAARAGYSDVAAVSAPSAQGVDLARRLGMFLAGFLRGDRMTVYSGVEALK